MGNTTTKNFLERDHSYQLSLLSIQKEDWMRGLYYINKDIKTLNFGIPTYAQHYMIQKLMKNFECRQFLGQISKIGFEDEQKINSRIFSSIESWIERSPNPVYDPLKVWDDIVTSRIMYLDAYENNINGFKQQLADNPKISDIRSLVYLQAAAGAKEMALYDSSEKYLRKAVDECKDLQSCTPLIVDLKIKQYRTKYLNEELKSNVERLNKIEEVIKRQKNNDNNDQSSLHQGYKLDLLLGDIKQMIMEVVIHNIKEDLIEAGDEKFYHNAMEKTYQIYKEIVEQEDSEDIEGDILTEANMKFALFADNILSSDQPVVKEALIEKGINHGMLAQILVKSGFAALNRGAPSSSSLIPRMLQVVSQYPEDCGSIFKEASKITPSWKFLGWKSQILALINEPISEIIFHTVVNLFKNYPEALFYAFKVVESDL